VYQHRSNGPAVDTSSTHGCLFRDVEALTQVGVIEIVAGVLVAVAPRIGGWVVAAWLLGIIVNLLLIPAYFDIALRDFGLALGAIALARLSEDYGG
jgi:hypothetical protein